MVAFARLLLLSGLFALMALLAPLPFGGTAYACDHAAMGENHTVAQQAAHIPPPAVIAPAAKADLHAHQLAAVGREAKTQPASKPCMGDTCCVAHCVTAGTIGSGVEMLSAGRPVVTLSAHTLLQGRSPAPEPDPPRTSF